ncbi:MAG TPA: beta-ketoacyl-ACP synthase 3 [Jatrophihabitantaceae bacterium]
MRFPLQSSPLVAGSRLLSVAASQPDLAVSGQELGERFGKSAEWIQARTGIRELRRLKAAPELLDLACDAATSALDRAALDAAQVDLLIVATCSADRHVRSSFGSRVSRALGLRAAEVELNAACSGFCYALSAADTMIRAGSVRRVLIVAAECMSDLIDEADLGTSIIFGDGAGAAVVGAAEADQVGVGPSVWGSDGDGADLIAVDDSGFLRMRGPEVFRWAVDIAPGLAERACAKAGVAVADIDVFVPHQANLRIVDAVARKLGLGEHVVVATDIVGSGNTSAASIPIALSQVLEHGQTRPGALALLVGFGAGLAYAAQVVQLP